MMKRFAALEIFIATLAVSCACRAEVPEQISAPLAVFDSYCLTASPDFGAIDRRATAAEYQMFQERNTPFGPGQSLRQKNWLIPLPSGAISLSAEEGFNGALHVVVCGISIRNVDGAEVEAVLSADPRLGVPVKRTPDTSGKGSSIAWLARLGAAVPAEDSQVLMVRDAPGLPSVIVNFIFRTRSDR